MVSVGVGVSSVVGSGVGSGVEVVVVVVVVSVVVLQLLLFSSSHISRCFSGWTYSVAATFSCFVSSVATPAFTPARQLLVSAVSAVFDALFHLLLGEDLRRRDKIFTPPLPPYQRYCNCMTVGRAGVFGPLARRRYWSGIRGCLYSDFGVGLFPTGAMFNHSCEPNCVWRTDALGNLRVSTVEDVPAGSQLFIS